jgi:hypothetical protein
VGDVLDGLGEGVVGCVERGVHGEFVFVFVFLAIVLVVVFAHAVIEYELVLAPGRLGAGCEVLVKGREGGEGECVLHDRFGLILGMRIAQIVVLSSQSILKGC